MGNPFLVSKMKKNDILLLFYSLKSGSCQYIGTEQLRDSAHNKFQFIYTYEVLYRVLVHKIAIDRTNWEIFRDHPLFCLHESLDYTQLFLRWIGTATEESRRLSLGRETYSS